MEKKYRFFLQWTFDFCSIKQRKEEVCKNFDHIFYAYDFFFLLCL